MASIGDDTWKFSYNSSIIDFMIVNDGKFLVIKLSYIKFNITFQHVNIS